MNYGCDSTAHPWLQNWWWGAAETRIPAPNTAYRRALEDTHRLLVQLDVEYLKAIHQYNIFPDVYVDHLEVTEYLRHRIAEMLQE